MAKQPKKMWMVRAGEGGKYLDRFFINGEAGINFSVGQCVVGMEREEIKRLYNKYARANKFSNRQIAYKAGTLYRFCAQFKQGDRVLTFDSRNQKYQVGIIRGGCEYRNEPGSPRESWHYRAVKWDGNPVPVSRISESFRNRMRPPQTIFSISEKLQLEILKKSGVGK